VSDHYFPKIVPAGDAAALVVLGDEISPEMNTQVRALAAAFERDVMPGVRELVLAYDTLLIHYDPLVLTFDQISILATTKAGEPLPLESEESRLREIPTVFGGAYGPDLRDVARHLHLFEEEVIRIFLEADYTVYMLGHTPGNPYMGGLPPRLAMPRLERPREKVPAGTVAIAHQACIYPLNIAPGGFRWLGRTAVKLFDPAVDPPNYLQAGDRVRFLPIGEEEYLKMGGVKCF
jgi:inhibitor of KinA